MLSNNDFQKKQIIIVFFSKGEKLSFLNDNVVIKNSEDKIIHQSTCYQLFAIYVAGNATITTGLIQRAKRFGFSIVLMTTTMKVYQIINVKNEGNSLLNSKQYAYDSLDIAKHIIINKMANQRELLNKQRIKDEEYKDVIKSIDEHITKVNTCGTLNDIMGYEGSVSRIYFKNQFNNINWNGRKPRIKNDMANALLDIGYTLLFSFIESLIDIYGFDVYVGILHRCFYMRKSLVCDIVEPFRCLIDREVKSGINLGQFKEKDFNIDNLRWELKWRESPKYVTALMEPILEHKKDIFMYIQSYYRAFMKQLDADKYPVFLLSDKT